MAKGEGGNDCLKYLMFFFNGLFFICGLVIFAIGLWVRFDENLNDFVDDDTADMLRNGAYVIIAFGVIITVLTFLGCCGAIKENQCMLAMFFIILHIILVALLTAGIFVLVHQDDTKEYIQDYFNKTTDEGFKIKVEQNMSSGKPLCSDAVWDSIEDRFPIVGGVALAVAIIIILGMVFSMVLCCSVRRSRNPA